MKKVQYQYTGKYAFHPVYGPVHQCIDGEFGVLPDDHADQLINAEWAIEVDMTEEDVEAFESSEDIEGQEEEGTFEEQPESSEEQGDPAEVPSLILPPWEEENWNPKSRNVKEKLEAYSIEVFGVDLDKRKTVTVLVEQLRGMIAASEEANNDN